MIMTGPKLLAFCFLGLLGFWMMIMVVTMITMKMVRVGLMLTTTWCLIMPEWMWGCCIWLCSNHCSNALLFQSIQSGSGCLCWCWRHLDLCPAAPIWNPNPPWKVQKMAAQKSGKQCISDAEKVKALDCTGCMCQVNQISMCQVHTPSLGVKWVSKLQQKGKNQTLTFTPRHRRHFCIIKKKTSTSSSSTNVSPATP